MPVIQTGDPSVGRVEKARLYKLARANPTQYLRRTHPRPGFQPILAYFQTVDDAGSVPRPPRGRLAVRASDATVSKDSKSTLTGAAIAGIIVASLAVLLLLFLSCYYLKRRRRKAPITHVPKVEHGFLRQGSDGLGSHGTLTASFSDGLPQPQSISTHRPSMSQSSSVTAVSVSPPTLPSSKVTDGKDEKALLPAPPPPLVLRPDRSDSLSMEQQPAPVRIEKSRSIKSTKSTKGRGRESVLPNPWDSDAKPSRAAFQSMVFKLPPSSIASIRPALPQTPRERRTSVSPELKPIEIDTN
ncbi:hypothetical protein BC827DRAFT_1156907 [Russula dissimulans]|nr:hypothetical protein BC827DRAFT_1156907 [Russula dissimulans]